MEQIFKISVMAWDNAGYRSLQQIVEKIAHLVVGFTWRLNVLEAAPEPGGQFLEEANPLFPMGYVDLLELISPDLQIIDGTASARNGYYEDGNYVIIRAVDSSYYEVESDVQEVALTIRNSFACIALS